MLNSTVVCVQGKRRDYALHCATALLLAVVSLEPFAPRMNCCLVAKGGCVETRRRLAPTSAAERRHGEPHDRTRLRQGKPLRALARSAAANRPEKLSSGRTASS